MHIKPGKIQELNVVEITSNGALLGDHMQTILLPKRDLRGSVETGQSIEVFVFYNDKRDLEATTKLPEVQVNEVGAFRVKNINDIGAFIDIGSSRDLLIPNREQREPLEQGILCVAIIKDDVENKRLYGSTKLTKYLKNDDISYNRGDEVDLVIAEKMELGRRVIINGKHHGVLFRQEIMRQVQTGEKLKGYVRQVEGKSVTVSTQKEGMPLLEDSRARVLEFLHANGGYVRLSDDTPPDEIKLRLRMSKKTFKKVAGMLFKEGLVELTKFGIKLTNKETAEPKKVVTPKKK